MCVCVCVCVCALAYTFVTLPTTYSVDVLLYSKLVKKYSQYVSFFAVYILLVKKILFSAALANDQLEILVTLFVTP